MWLTDSFLLTFFGRWRGQYTYTLIPVWLTCGAHAGWWGGGHSELRKAQKVQKTCNFYKGGGEH